MNAYPPILAAGAGDFIYIILMLLFVVVPIIGQILAKLNQQQPGGGQKPQRPKPVDADVADEIETFMSRVLGEKEQPAARLVERPRPVEQPIVVEVVEEPPIGGGVAEHVKRNIRSEELSSRASQLGHDVALTDERFNQREEKTFDHSLGDLKTPALTDLAEPSTVEIPSTFASGLAALLSDAESARQAIVLSEIINRPDERWA